MRSVYPLYAIEQEAIFGCTGGVNRYHRRSLGYQVSLYFLQLPTAEMAIERVRLRVAQGGHHIPAEVVRRRFAAGLQQFENTYKPIVNAWFLYDNQHRQPTLLARGANS